MNAGVAEAERRKVEADKIAAMHASKPHDILHGFKKRQED
jgi:hypothetical protein